MPRYRLTIEYRGTRYCGWQKQHHCLSVQQVLEQALSALADHRIVVRGAGRTDAGVHATGQIAHVDLERTWSSFKLLGAINAHLAGSDVAVLEVAETDDAFHARFSAIKRHYHYRIVNRRPHLALDRGLAWHVPVKLEAQAMHVAAQVLVGQHDFTTFRSTECQAASPVRTLDRIQVDEIRNSHQAEIDINVSARSFLHNQVRSIVGSLKLVGEGKWTAENLQAALQARDRSACGPVAPPDGLYLHGVDY
jgi:tRNA pseudouridine38-40 synthase